jgi:hypothetical protein
MSLAEIRDDWPFHTYPVRLEFLKQPYVHMKGDRRRGPLIDILPEQLLATKR